MTAIYFIFGIVLYTQAAEVIEFSERYDDKIECENNIGGTCEITISIDDDMKEPIFVYYELKNFYQNHRNYVKSRSDAQNRAKDMSQNEKDAMELNCKSVLYWEDLWKWKNPDANFVLKAIEESNGELSSAEEFKDQYDDKEYAHPCGLTAATYFNDTFALSRDEKIFDIDSENIAWESDIETKFQNLDSDEMYKKQWLDLENEQFAVWMRLAAMPDFRKFVGRIEKDMDSGDYTLTIVNNYDVSEWNGEKHIILSTANKLGGRNFFLGTLFLAAGGFCALIDITFIMIKLIRKRER